MFTSEQLDALQAAAEAATPGPWVWVGSIEDDEAFLFSRGEDRYVLSAYGEHTVGFLEVNDQDATFMVEWNPAVALELVAAHRAALSRIARVEAIHAPRSIQVVTGDCALGECEHTDECPTVPFEQCVACDELAETVNTYYVEALGFVTAWPCPTVRALAEGEPSE